MPRAEGNNNNSFFIRPGVECPPCRNCKNRSVYCHTTCEDYIEYKRKLSCVDILKLDRKLKN